LHLDPMLGWRRLETKVFLIRHGVTEWHTQGRVAGQRDVPMSAEGRDQVERTAKILSGLKIAEVISSPLQRAIQTAEIIASGRQIEVARDPRLTDFQLGKWTGMTYDDVTATPDYQRFVAEASTGRIPDGESLEEVRRRAVGAVEQSLGDNPTG